MAKGVKPDHSKNRVAISRHKGGKVQGRVLAPDAATEEGEMTERSMSDLYLNSVFHIVILACALFDEPRRSFYYTVSGVTLGLLMVWSSFTGKSKSLVVGHQYYRFLSRVVIPFTMMQWYVFERHQPSSRGGPSGFVRWGAWWGEFGFHFFAFFVLLTRFGPFTSPRFAKFQSLALLLYRESWTLKCVFQGIAGYPNVSVLIQAVAEFIVASGMAIGYLRGFRPWPPAVIGLATAVYSGAKLSRSFVW